MEILLIGTRVKEFKIISCGYSKEFKGYSLGYKCEKCGNRYDTILISKRVCSLRCNNCNKRSYIAPIINKVGDKDILGYNLLDINDYRKIRKRYKEEGRGEDFMLYVNEYIRRMRKLEELEEV